MIFRRCLLAALAFGVGVAGSARVASTNERLSSMGHFIPGLTLANWAFSNRLPGTVGGVGTGAAYDIQGNLTAIYGTPGSSTTQLTMTYDALGRVTALGDTKNATSQTYGYDDEGLRIKTFDSKTGLIAYNIYDEGRRLIAQYEVSSGGSLTWKKDLLYVGDKEIAELDANGKTWVTFDDHLGSPRYEWDGTATSTMDGVHLIAQKYAPFGEYLNDPTTQAKFAKGFTNHEQTDPSGLIYMQARFYLPMYGRFASPDPARDQHFEQTQSWNIYSYVQNDPTMRIDPTGMIGGFSDLIKGYLYRSADNATVGYLSTAQHATGAGGAPPTSFAGRVGMLLADGTTFSQGIGLTGGGTGGGVVTSESGVGAVAGYAVAAYGVAVTGASIKSTITDVKSLMESSGSGGGEKSPDISHQDLEGKTRDEIRGMANDKGLEPTGKPDTDGPRKWKDPATGQERLRLDRGHVDPKTGKPFDKPSAAVDHAHGYTPDGKPIRHPETGDKHFPTR